MPAKVVAAARKAGIFVQQLESLEEVLPDTDVLYVTRVQRERFKNELEWQAVKDSYRIDHALLSRAKEDMIVMHPLPRVNGKIFAAFRNSRAKHLTIHRNRSRSRFRLPPRRLLPPDALRTFRQLSFPLTHSF
jgi:carbamoyl-phosphate synthase/aspartate carbamoyltransferase